MKISYGSSGAEKKIALFSSHMAVSVRRMALVPAVIRVLRHVACFPTQEAGLVLRKPSDHILKLTSFQAGVT